MVTYAWDVEDSIGPSRALRYLNALPEYADKQCLSFFPLLFIMFFQKVFSLIKKKTTSKLFNFGNFLEFRFVNYACNYISIIF